MEDKFTSYPDVFKHEDTKKLNKILSLEEKILTHIKKCTVVDEKSNAKKIVLEATLKYLQNPTLANKQNISQAKKEHPKFNESLLGNSTTGYLVDKATALILIFRTRLSNINHYHISG